MGNEISIERISAKLDAERSIWKLVGELCCRTGNGGDPIANERWEIFERIWIEPYRVLRPEWSYVALADQRVIGYLTGCPHTARFAQRCFVRCTLPLLWQIAWRPARDPRQNGAGGRGAVCQSGASSGARSARAR